MRDTSDLDEAGHPPGWRADWNIADLLRAASAGEVVDESTLVQDLAPAAEQVTWA